MFIQTFATRQFKVRSGHVCMSIVSLFDNHWLASHLASQGNGATHLEVMRACGRFGRARVTQYLVRQGDGAPLLGDKCSFRFWLLMRTA